MKKNIFIISTLLFGSLLLSQMSQAITSQQFINKFSTCSHYVDNGEKRISAILGWSTRRCYYKEITHQQEVLCGFKQLELQDVVKAMKKENYDPSKGLTSLKTINNYLYFSPEICTIKDSNNTYSSRNRNRNANKRKRR